MVYSIAEQTTGGTLGDSRDYINYFDICTIFSRVQRHIYTWLCV